MEKKLVLIPVRNIEGFKPQRFVVYPDRHIVYSYKHPELVEQAKLAALEVQEVCIAVFQDELGEFALGTPCEKGLSERFILFNAQICNRVDAEMRAVTWNTGRGALSMYWYDEFIRYEKGGVV